MVGTEHLVRSLEPSAGRPAPNKPSTKTRVMVMAARSCDATRPADSGAAFIPKGVTIAPIMQLDRPPLRRAEI